MARKRHWGRRRSPGESGKIVEWLQQLFADTGLFDEVRIVDQATLGASALSRPVAAPDESSLVLVSSNGFHKPRSDTEEDFTGIHPWEALVIVELFPRSDPEPAEETRARQ